MNYCYIYLVIQVCSTFIKEYFSVSLFDPPFQSINQQRDLRIYVSAFPIYLKIYISQHQSNILPPAAICPNLAIHISVRCLPF